MEFPISPSEKRAAACCAAPLNNHHQREATGAGAAAPAPLGGPVLTIDRPRLRGLFLQTAARRADSLEYMDKACLRAVGTKRHGVLNTARCAVGRELDQVVDQIVARGGLLHVGVRGAL